MVLSNEKNHDSVQYHDNPTGYLVCSYCRGYYELQEDETPDDFERCECGNQLEFRQSMSQLHSNSYHDNFNETDPNSEYDDFTEMENKNLDDSLNIKTIPLAENKSIVKQFPPQALVSKETIINIQQDNWDLWDMLDQFQSGEEYENQKMEGNDVIEMNRLRMMVDQRKALEGNYNQSRAQSASQRIGPIGFLSAAIVLLIIVLSLILTTELL